MQIIIKQSGLCFVLLLLFQRFIRTRIKKICILGSMVKLWGTLSYASSIDSNRNTSRIVWAKPILDWKCNLYRKNSRWRLQQQHSLTLSLSLLLTAIYDFFCHKMCVLKAEGGDHDFPPPPPSERMWCVMATNYFLCISWWWRYLINLFSLLIIRFGIWRDCLLLSLGYKVLLVRQPEGKWQPS